MPLDSQINYDLVAAGYDRSRGVEPSIASKLAEGLRILGAESVLEIGAGTGNYTADLSARGFSVVALDRSIEMISRGRMRGPAWWIRGDALSLPLREQSIDAATAVNVMHHLGDLRCALSEFRRVIRAGIAIQAVVRENLASLWYRHYFPEIDSVLLPLHPPLGTLVTSMLRVGFTRVRSASVFYSGCGDLTFEAARTRPRLLFDANFRAATSGFRRLSAGAIERGLARLEQDLATGRFDEAARRFETEHAAIGDCVVVVAAVQ